MLEYWSCPQSWWWRLWIRLFLFYHFFCRFCWSKIKMNSLANGCSFWSSPLTLMSWLLIIICTFPFALRTIGRFRGWWMLVNILQCLGSRRYLWLPIGLRPISFVGLTCSHDSWRLAPILWTHPYQCSEYLESWIDMSTGFLFLNSFHTFKFLLAEDT